MNINGCAPAARADSDLLLWSLYAGIGAAIYELHNLRCSQNLPPFEELWERENVLDYAFEFATDLMRRRAEQLGEQP